MWLELKVCAKAADPRLGASHGSCVHTEIAAMIARIAAGRMEAKNISSFAGPFVEQPDGPRFLARINLNSALIDLGLIYSYSKC